jgi:hypothetical protein
MSLRSSPSSMEEGLNTSGCEVAMARKMRAQARNRSLEQRRKNMAVAGMWLGFGRNPNLYILTVEAT